MKRKMLFVLGAALVLGVVIAVAAVAQDAGNEKKERRAHECTQEMMENPDKMAKDCPPEMMESDDCENMTDASMEGCSSMMESDDHMADPDHCGGSMMGTPEGSMMQQL